MSIQQMLMGGEAIPVLAPVTNILGATSAGLRLDANGNLVPRVNGADQAATPWLVPQINMASYEARMTLISGAIGVGNTGVFEALSASRTYEVVITPSGFTGTLEIRRIGGSTILATSAITFTTI